MIASRENVQVELVKSEELHSGKDHSTVRKPSMACFDGKTKLINETGRLKALFWVRVKQWNRRKFHQKF